MVKPNINPQNSNHKSPPVFVIGVDRSGTTLLSLMLDAHSQLLIPYESKFFARFYHQKDEFGDLQNVDNRIVLIKKILDEPSIKLWQPQVKLEDIDLEKCTSLPECIEAVFYSYAMLQGKSIWGDKTPSYINGIHILNKLFPTARYIHIVRDGRDVASSLVRQEWGPCDFISSLRFWQERVSCARRLLRMLPDEQWIEIRFEDLVSEPEKILKSITDLLNIDYEETMVDGYIKKSELRVGDLVNTIHPNLKQRPSTKQAYKWKKNLSPADQAIAFEIAGKMLEQYHYEPGITHHPLKIIKEIYHRFYASVIWRFKTNHE